MYTLAGEGAICCDDFNSLYYKEVPYTTKKLDQRLRCVGKIAATEDARLQN